MQASHEQQSQHTLESQYGGKYLTFKLGAEEYGIQILKIREIIGLINITKVPRMPDYVMGVINLRGKVIPIVDLRLKFGMVKQDYTKLTCIIVVEVTGSKGNFLLGTVVDTVNEVMNFTAENVEPVPAYGNGVQTEFIHAMGKINGQVKILLDIDEILGEVELDRLQNSV